MLGKFADGMGKIGTLGDTALLASATVRAPQGVAVAAQVGFGAGLIEGGTYAIQGMLGDSSKYRSAVSAIIGAVLPDPIVPKSLQNEVGNFVFSKVVGATDSMVPNKSLCD